MKQINKKHRWLACLLAFIMLIGVVEPLGIVKAEGTINTGTLALTSAYANGTSGYSYACLEFQSQVAISLPEGGALTAVADHGDILRNGSSVLGKLNFKVTNVAGTFLIDGIEGTGSFPQVTDTFTIQGQFTLPGGSVVEFPTTTFQYMGTNTSGYGYWRDYTGTVESGALTLAPESLNGTNQYGWGGFRFTTANGYVPAPRGINTQKFQSDGGTVTLKADQNAEEVVLTLGTDINLKSGDTDRSQKYYIEDYKNGAFTAGNILTIQGKFKTEDGFSIEFPKTSFMYEGKTTDESTGTAYLKWSYYTEPEEESTEIAELELATAYATGANDYTALMLQFQSKTSVSIPAGTLNAVDGSGEILRNGKSIENQDASAGKAIQLKVNAQGLFSLDNMQYAMNCNGIYGFPVETETFSVKGKFNIVDNEGQKLGSVIISETTFQYMGLNANTKGYWRNYKETVESGALSLDNGILNGTDQYGFGVVTFTMANGYVPAPRGKATQIFKSDGGTITLKADQNAEEISLALGTDIKLKAAKKSEGGKYYLEDYKNYSFTAGNIITIQGTFKTEDGFSINIPKTAFQYEGNNKWSYFTQVRSSGEVTLNSGFESSVVKFWPQNATDVTFSNSEKLVAVAGKGSVLQNGKDISSSIEVWSYTSGLHAIWGVSSAVGTELTFEGDFALSSDPTVVVRYPKIVFKIIEMKDGSKKWVQVRTTNYVESGGVTVHDNSASQSTSQVDIIYFETDDRSLAKNTAGDGWLRAEEGTILYNGSDITSSVLHAGNARIYSYSNGVYLIYLQRNAVDGTEVTIQGSFAMADGSMGVDLQPITLKYVLPEGAEKGYWVTVGMNFSSDKHWQVESAYEEDILRYEATVRLSKTATKNGGVILGNCDESGNTYTLGVDANGAPYLKLKDSNNEATYQFASDVRTGEWVTIKILFDGNSVFYYEDGVLKEIVDQQGIESVTTTAKAVIGGDYSKGNANYFKGTIRDVKLYADVDGNKLIASYDMGSLKKSTKTISDNNEEKAYDAAVTLRWVDTAPTIGEYAYSFAVIGDTQAINDKNGNKNNGPLTKVYDYIVDNVSKKNIKFAFGLGDITENDDATEWERAKEQIRRLDGVVPYNLNRGNHDSSAKMNEYFSYSTYKDKVSGSMSGTIENTCQLLTVGQVDYLIFSLDFGASDAVLNWAASIIESHPNHNVIITTHSYLTRDGKYTTRDNDTSLASAPSTGQDIWDKLVSQHKNIVMVISGHVYANDIIVNEATGKYGNTIKQIVVNPQVADAMTDGGTGMVAMLYFSEDGKNVQVEYYSTVREQWLADTNQFTMELDVVEHVDAVTVEPFEYAKFITHRTEGNYTAPTKEGYLFAGWFTDEACNSPLMDGAAVDETKTYYAKFVDKYAQVVKRQVNDEELMDLRLVTTLDSLNYKEVGFIVDFGDDIPTLTHPFTKAYKTLHGAGILYHPIVFSSASKYFATLLITNIPVETLGADRIVTVTTYWITYDGTKVTSAPDEKVLKPTGY